MDKTAELMVEEKIPAGRLLTTSTGFGPIPNIIYDADVFLSWLFVECSRSVKVLDPVF